MYRRGPPSAVCCEAAPPSGLRSKVVSSLPIHSFDSSVIHSRKRRHARMASATATATMAAAGFDKRSSTSSSLATPGSGGFPSEMRSPLAGSPSFLKQKENGLKTPITPPSAYLDFLKNMSPAMMSPAPTSTSARFSFTGDSDRASESSFHKPSSISPPTSQPALSRNTSYDSNASTSTNKSAASSRSNASTTRQRPESPRVVIPPSPFAKPAPRSARTPRKLTIPQSPFSATLPSAALQSAKSLHSARSINSPYSSTPLSAAPWSASYEAKDVDTEANGKPGKVTVKQVVTRTVTYCRTPLETVPDGSLWKRRKMEHEGTPPKSGSEEPEIKQEKLEEIIESEISKEATPEQPTMSTTTSPPPAKDDA